MQEYFTMSKTSYELENAELWVQLDSNGGSVSNWPGYKKVRRHNVDVSI